MVLGSGVRPAMVDAPTPSFLRLYGVNMSSLGPPMFGAEARIYELWLALAKWHGADIADLIAKANNRGDIDFDEPALWDSDPDLALIVSDLLDVESMLIFSGCLDNQLCR